MINAILRFFGGYDLNGLKHSRSHVAEMKYQIAFLTRREQADYADKMTVRGVDDFEVCKAILESRQGVSFWYNNEDNLDATTVGNLAYISLHNSSYAVRIKAERMLRHFREFVVLKQIKGGSR